MAEGRHVAQPGSPVRPAQDEHKTSRRPGVEVLTRRELDVAILIARGLSNREIAGALVITVGTAQSYVHRILTRLDFTRRAQVAAWAVARGLHELEIGR